MPITTFNGSMAIHHRRLAVSQFHGCQSLKVRSIVWARVPWLSIMRVRVRGFMVLSPLRLELAISYVGSMVIDQLGLGVGFG